MRKHILIVGHIGGSALTESLLNGHRDPVIIGVPQRLTKTTEAIHALAEATGKSAEDITHLLKSLSSIEPNELKSLKFPEPEIEALDCEPYFFDKDERPFYQKLADKGGKKRKQKYYNRQKW